MLINEIEDLAFENYYKRIGFSIKISYNSRKRLNKKDLLLLANKLIKNKSDLHNAKEHYQLFIIKKNWKSVKQSEIITYQLKTFDIVDIKSVNNEHPKTSYKLSKSTRQTEKLGSNSSLYCDTKKDENFLNENKNKNKKTRTCF